MVGILLLSVDAESCTDQRVSIGLGAASRDIAQKYAMYRASRKEITSVVLLYIWSSNLIIVCM